MSNFLLIAISLFVGLLMQQLPSVPKGVHKGLNATIIHLSLPAVTLLYVPQLDMRWEMAYPFAMAFIVWGVGWGFFELLGRQLGWDSKLRGGLALVAGMGNISFVGYPVIEALYQDEGLQTAIFLGQGGFLVVSVIGVMMASAYSSTGKGNLSKLFIDLWKFPPFLSFVLGGILWGLGWEWPEDLATALKTLGQTLTPLAMASIGLQLQLRLKSLPWKELGAGLLYKLIIAPLCILLLYGFLLDNEPLLLKVSVVEAAMPPMVTASIIASEYGLVPKLGSTLVGLGLLASALTLPFWVWVLG